MAIAQDIKNASLIIKRGGLVAFPTETVYGLGANAFDDKAVAEIFICKGRPQFNPLIVHIASLKQAKDIVSFNDWADRLANAFWPGPITFVLPRKDERISLLVSAGLDTLAVRMPAHPVAREFLEATSLPIAAPSANISGTLSPTTADDVKSSLGDRVEMVLDGGSCEVGLESTIVDLTGDVPVLLRAGGITLEHLEDVLGFEVIVSAGNPNAPKSPGQLLSHYAPFRPLRINASEPRDGEFFIGFGAGDKSAKAPLNLSKRADLKEAAANLFSFLRLADKAEGYAKIAIAPVPKDGVGLAINDRLKRAQHL